MAKSKRRKTTSCGAVAWRLGQAGIEILLIKQFEHKDNWGIPKGHMDDGETLEACAVREVREETGVEVILRTRLPDVQIALKGEDKTVVTYVALPVDSEAEPNHNDPDSEVADARWFPIGALPPIHGYQAPVIAKAIELVQDGFRILSGTPGISQ